MTTTMKAAKKFEGFSAEERAAMKEHAKALKSNATDPLAELLAKIAEMDSGDRALASKIHEIVTANAPELTPRLYYGMPAYAKNGKVLCFFQPAKKFKTRYATFGFNDGAGLDDGNVWPTVYAITRLTEADCERLAALVQRAA